MKISENKQADFIVRNSVVILVIIATVFLCMLACVFQYNTSLGTTGYIIVAALAPVIGYFIIKKSKAALIRINRNGIYSHESLVTDWKHFKSATTDQLPLNIGDPRDKVVLIVEHYNLTRDKLYTKKIPLHNTYNKSEEQILAAIDFFKKQA